MPSFEERFEKMRRDTIEHPKVQQFLKEHEQEVTKEMVEISLPKLFGYINQSTSSL